MANTTEIEYKFLIADIGVISTLTPLSREYIMQGYLTKPGDGSAIRVRASEWEDGRQEAFFTVKSPTPGLARKEWEYPIPLQDAQEMMALAEGRIIVKTRYRFAHTNGHIIELDMFDGVHSGLVVAEIEVGSVDEKIDIPDWFGADVTHDGRYTNISLALNGLNGIEL